MIKRKISRAIGILLATLLALVVLLFAIPETYYLLPLGRGSAEGVSSELVLALVDHQPRTLQSISDSDVWPRIDEWMENHQEVDCDGPLWWEPLDVSPIEHQVIVEEPGYRQETIVLSRYCSNNEDLYCVRVNAIALRETAAGWIVEDWGEVTETRISQSRLCSFE